MNINDALQEYTVQVLGETIKLADRYGADRDEVIDKFAFYFSNLAELCSFKGYKVEGGN